MVIISFCGCSALIEYANSSLLAPTMPPSITKLQNISSTALFVQWQAPIVKSQHGRIRGYKVFYRKETSCNSSSTPTTASTTVSTTKGTTTKRSVEPSEPSKKPLLFRRSLLSSGSGQSGFQSTGDLPSTSSNTNLTGLNKWTCYSVYVICWTVAPSKPSGLKSARTAEDSKCAIQ